MPKKNPYGYIDFKSRITIQPQLVERSSLKEAASVAFATTDMQNVIRVIDIEAIKPEDSILDIRKLHRNPYRIVLPSTLLKMFNCNTGDTIKIFLRDGNIFIAPISE